MSRGICSLVAMLGLLSASAAARLHLPLSGDGLKEPPDGGNVVCTRELTVPAESASLRPLLVFRMLNARAEVSVDGQPAGVCEFPGGSVDLSNRFPAGKTVRLEVRLSDASGASKYGIRGVSGETFLEFVPREGHVCDAFVTAVSTEEVKVVAEVSETLRTQPIRLEAVISDGVETRRFQSDSVVAADGRLTCAVCWPGAKTWDTSTPGNRYTARVSVLGPGGRTIDTFPPVTFGFRAFEVRGRGFALNDIPIRLRGFYTRLLNGSAAKASAASIGRELDRMKRLGGNFLITGNFGFACGEQRAPDELLDACDAAGVLVAYSLPHVKEYPDEGVYRVRAEQAIRLARSHPCVVLYTTSHNWCGYDGDLNPLKIDGRFDPTDDPRPLPTWKRHRAQAARAEEIIRAIDPTRPVHHHAGGDIGELYSVNAYFNWMPAQERSDWPELWATNGVKPLVAIEWGLPYEPSWSSYRGPEFIWKVKALQSCWAAEYAAALFGDAAYLDTPAAHAALRTESLLRRKGPFEWTRLAPSLKRVEANYNGVQAEYAADNWRSLRAWGVPAIIPQNQSEFFRRGAADVTDELTASGAAIRRWNAPLIGFVGGADVFTDKRRAYRPGETLRKSLVVVNDLREPAEVDWSAALSSGASVTGQVCVAAGGTAFVPIALKLPETAGPVRLTAQFACAAAPMEDDAFEVTVVSEKPASVSGRLAVFDPEGRTFANLKRLGLAPVRLSAPEKAGDGDVLAIGRNALASNTLERLAARVTRGLRVVVFEQSASALQAAGFRVTEYGLRRVFPRDESLFAGLTTRDWAGESTLVAPYLEGLPRFEHASPADSFAPVGATRVWRCRMRGAVASVLPEKPERGGWRALADGGFDLRYAPLLARRQGRGSVVLCQLDVTARTAADPAADELVKRLVSWTPPAVVPGATVVRGAVARALCDVQGVRAVDSAEACSLLVCSAGERLPWTAEAFRARIEAGMNVLMLDMRADELKTLLPELTCARMATAAYPVRFPDGALPTCLAGCSNADWMWHGAVSVRTLSGAGVGTPSLRVLQIGKGTVVVWQASPNRIDAAARPELRLSLRHAHYLLSCLLANLGADAARPDLLYVGDRLLEDEPYRYYRW